MVWTESFKFQIPPCKTLISSVTRSQDQGCGAPGAGAYLGLAQLTGVLGCVHCGEIMLEAVPRFKTTTEPGIPTLGV